jgi:hypothetical protein
LARGLLDYFPAALAAVAQLSMKGAEKHCGGELFHNRERSGDHADCIMRHLMERGKVDPEDGLLHEVKVAWRALALLQQALEKKGAPEAPAARYPSLEGLQWAGATVTPDPNCPHDTGIRIPVIHWPEIRECENNVKDRIAGTTAAAQTIKNQYYLGTRFPVGSQVLCDDGWTGNVIEVLNDSIVSVRWTHSANGKQLRDNYTPFVTNVHVGRLTLVMK